MAMTRECVELLLPRLGFIERSTIGCGRLFTAGRLQIAGSLRRKPRALLRAESACDKAHMTVTPYEERKVSLPESVRGAKYADTIGGARARDLLERFVERRRRSPEEIVELEQIFGLLSRAWMVVWSRVLGSIDAWCASWTRRV